MMEVRRSMTLSDHMSRSADGDNARAANRRSQTLRETFATAASSRTLMDIIREEHAISRGEFPLKENSSGVSWRAFKDRLRLRRTSAAWADAATGGGDDEDDEIVIGFPTSPVFGRAIAARLNQARMPGSVTLRERIDSDYAPTAAESAQVTVSAVAEESLPSTVEEEQTERVSLMALLGQSDPEAGSSESDEEENDEDVEAVEEVGGEMKHVCCVCMVRHKGAAFIPCGHTFCRLCSRELWVSRGNCPLCNGYILEILDIF